MKPKPITIEGCACVIGKRNNSRLWSVWEPQTSLAVSLGHETRKEAIESAIRQIQRAGGKETFEMAIELHT